MKVDFGKQDWGFKATSKGEEFYVPKKEHYTFAELVAVASACNHLQRAVIALMAATLVKEKK